MRFAKLSCQDINKMPDVRWEEISVFQGEGAESHVTIGSHPSDSDRGENDHNFSSMNAEIPHIAFEAR